MVFLPEPGKGPLRCRYDDRTILMVVLWAILHDRPMNWACCPENWSASERPARLPSESTR